MRAKRPTRTQSSFRARHRCRRRPLPTTDRADGARGGGAGSGGRRIAIALLVAFLPAAILGFVADEAIERRLFGPWPVVAAWTSGSILILVVAPRMRRGMGAGLEVITLRSALIIGVAQCAALWPGVSRSLSTILGALAAGLVIGAAVEFSFLLGLVTLGAATAYKALDSAQAMIDAYGGPEIAIGFLAAWVSAVLAVKWMVGWLSKRDWPCSDGGASRPLRLSAPSC